MKNYLPPSRLKGLSAIVLAFMLTPLHGAVTWPVVDHYTWNFDLGTGGPSSSTTDTLTIQLDAGDPLLAPERMLIRMYAGDATEPMFSKDWNGQSFSLNGLLLSVEDWDAPLAALWGRLELDMKGGSVDLHLLALSIGTGTRRYATSIISNVHLVPEPGVAILVIAAGGLALRRRRAAGNQDSPPGFNQ